MENLEKRRIKIIGKTGSGKCGFLVQCQGIHFFAGISPEKLFLLSCKLPLPFSAKVAELGTSYGESWYRIQCILVQVAVELDTQYIRIYRHTLPYVQPDTYIRVDSYVSNVTGDRSHVTNVTGYVALVVYFKRTGRFFKMSLCFW